MTNCQVARKILDFFDTRVKKVLRKQPENFKLLLTSREIIPSGFKQIELIGLNKRDSKTLMTSIFKRYKSSQKCDLSNQQKEELYLNTKGIPILIKHSYAKIFEYNEPIETVLRGLSNLKGNIVQFSFKEILFKIEKDRDQIALKILVLLEIVDIPLMIRQISDIIEVDQTSIENKIPLLVNFECLKSKNFEDQEKYYLYDEIRLLTKSLAVKNPDLVKELRHKYYRNFTFDKQMDYTVEEAEIINIFEGYIKNKEDAEARKFIEKELSKRPQSILLNFYYAKYLKDGQYEVEQAIEILENLRITSRNHPSVLRLLFNCFASSSIPNYKRAESLVNQIKTELGEYLNKEPSMQLEIARFYIRWSISIKDSKGIDPYAENERVAKYKELAQNAFNILTPIKDSMNNNQVVSVPGAKLHEVYYGLAQCHYNLWEYDEALKNISKAIILANDLNDNTAKNTYTKFRTNDIIRNKYRYNTT